MRSNLPQIGQLAQRVRVALYQAVKAFPRSDKYGIGADLNRDARDVVRKIRKAWLQSDPRRRRALIQQVSDAIDELKDSMQLAGDLPVFRSSEEFAAIARLVEELGNQCGGWLKDRTDTGQNGRAASPVQRAQTLSSPAASLGAMS